MLRHGLARVISQKDNLEVIGEASTGAEALALAVELIPDLVVMDVHVPDGSGIKAAAQILKVLPATRIVIFSSDSTRARIDEALAAGASAYVVKTDAVFELAEAIDTVMAGRIFLSRAVSAGIVEDYTRGLRGEAAPPQPGLSERERQLLTLIADGKRNKEIAAEFGVSIKSVEAQRSRLMKKLGFTSSAGMVRYAVREGFASA